MPIVAGVNEGATTYAARFTTFTSDIDLTAQSGYPPIAVERLVLVNATAGALTASLVDVGGKTYTVTVRAGETWLEPHQVVTIAAATADTFTEIRAYWRSTSVARLNP